MYLNDQEVENVMAKTGKIETKMFRWIFESRTEENPLLPAIIMTLRTNSEDYLMSTQY